jgi:hypothetical protein
MQAGATALCSRDEIPSEALASEASYAGGLAAADVLEEHNEAISRGRVMRIRGTALADDYLTQGRFALQKLPRSSTKIGVGF